MKKLIPLVTFLLLVFAACQSGNKSESENHDSSQDFGTRAHEDSLRHTPMK